MTQNFLTRIALMAALTTAAFAQDRHYNFTSPEPFVANGAKFPAGEYRVSPVKGVASAFSIQAKNGNERAYVPMLHQREISRSGNAKMLLVCAAKGCEFGGIEDPSIGLSFHSKSKTPAAASTIRLAALPRAAATKSNE